jgi:hypothetical protein
MGASLATEPKLTRQHTPKASPPSPSPRTRYDSPAGMPLFLQRSPLAINQPDDVYEQEADSTA